MMDNDNVYCNHRKVCQSCLWVLTVSAVCQWQESCLLTFSSNITNQNNQNRNCPVVLRQHQHTTQRHQNNQIVEEKKELDQSKNVIMDCFHSFKTFWEELTRSWVECSDWLIGAVRGSLKKSTGTVYNRNGSSSGCLKMRAAFWIIHYPGREMFTGWTLNQT